MQPTIPPLTTTTTVPEHNSAAFWQGPVASTAPTTVPEHSSAAFWQGPVASTAPTTTKPLTDTIGIPTTSTLQKKPTAATTNRHGKSRPGSLAQMHLALLKHMETTQNDNGNVNIDEEALRQILHDQSGSKAHHAVHVANPRDAMDPLCHLLTISSACGAGTEPPVFRHDKANLGIRMAPELLLEPILKELQLLKQAWLTPVPTPGENLPETWNPAKTHQNRNQACMEDLRAPCGINNSIHHGTPRPLW